MLLQYMERLSVAEIAVVMGRSLASVKSLLQRARATLYRRGAELLSEDESGWSTRIRCEVTMKNRDER